MTNSANDGGLADDQFGADEFAPEEMDELFDVLADRRRRCTLAALRNSGGTIAFDDLVGAVARETVTQPIDRARRREIATSLYHVHLPKLATLGLVSEYDPDGDVVAAERVEDVPQLLFD